MEWYAPSNQSVRLNASLVTNSLPTTLARSSLRCFNFARNVSTLCSVEYTVPKVEARRLLTEGRSALVRSSYGVSGGRPAMAYNAFGINVVLNSRSAATLRVWTSCHSRDAWMPISLRMDGRSTPFLMASMRPHAKGHSKNFPHTPQT